MCRACERRERVRARRRSRRDVGPGTVLKEGKKRNLLLLLRESSEGERERESETRGRVDGERERKREGKRDRGRVARGGLEGVPCVAILVRSEAPRGQARSKHGSTPLGAHVYASRDSCLVYVHVVIVIFVAAVTAAVTAAAAAAEQQSVRRDCPLPLGMLSGSTWHYVAV